MPPPEVGSPAHDSPAPLQQAAHARERGELAEARRWAQLALADDPADPRAHVLLGSLAHLEGALPEAAALYRQALAHAPADATAHAALAVVLAQLGQLTTARAHARAALAADATGALATVPWLRTFRQARELAAATPHAIRPWERCATPLLHAAGPTQPITPPHPHGTIPWTVADLVAALRPRPRLVALTGAGLSVASGLATRKQLWQRFVRDDAVSAVRFRAAPHTLWTVIRAFWGETAHPPNSAHLSLATLPNLQAIVTQNVDDLHQLAAAQRGTTTPVLELHGSLSRTCCVACQRPGEPAQTLAARDPLPPRCPACGGVLRPEVVLFGETVPAPVWTAARHAVESADLLLVVGCAMDVSPASELPLLAAHAGARIVEIKRHPSRLGSVAPVHHIAGLAEDILPQIRAAFGPP